MTRQEDEVTDRTRLRNLITGNWAAVAALIAAGGVGAAIMAASTNRDHDAAIEELERRQSWIICSTVPPHRNDVLSALGETCPYDGPDRRSIRGIPLLEPE